MAGWNLKNGTITEYDVGEDRIWSLFNFVFSDACKKRNTYKLGLIKALLDSAFSGETTQAGIRYSYEELFSRFTYNYWNLVVKYNLRQMRKDGKSEYSRVELILKSALVEDSILGNLEFDAVEPRKNAHVP